MEIKTLLTSVAVTGALLTSAAHAKTIVTSGEASITFSESFSSLGLTVESWTENADGSIQKDFTIRPGEGVDYEWTTSSGVVRSSTARASNESVVIDDENNAYLKLASSTTYIDPTDADGNVIESMATVWVLPQNGDDADLFSDELRDINYVPTADPLVWEDFENPGSSYTFTAEEAAYFTEEVDGLRLCCTHSLGNLAIGTAAMTIDGVIDGISERDINFDGVIDENDNFYLFDLVATTEDGVYDMALTATAASFLNYGFSSAGYADSTEFDANWSNALGYLDFAGGDVVGNVSFSYDVAAVPVPASLPLLVGGLGFIGYVGRRRSKRKAA